jgi:hypothetical protein
MLVSEYELRSSKICSSTAGMGVWCACGALKYPVSSSAERSIRAVLRTTGSNAAKLALARNTKHRFQIYWLRWYRPASPSSTMGSPMTR